MTIWGHRRLGAVCGISRFGHDIVVVTGTSAIKRVEIMIVRRIYDDKILLETDGESLSGLNLAGYQLECAELSGMNLTNANLSGANLRNSRLLDADLSGANLNGADITGAHLDRAKLRAANLEEALLVGTYLPYADLEGANLGGAWVFGARMNGAIVIGADMRVVGINELQGVYDCVASLESAVYDVNTQWPSDYDPMANRALLATKLDWTPS